MVQQLLAGDRLAGSKIRSRMSTVLWSTRKDREMSVRCARKRGRCQCRQESEGSRGLPAMATDGVHVCEMAALFASSLAIEWWGNRGEAREGDWRVL
jgi:hypothetical protein